MMPSRTCYRCEKYTFRHAETHSRRDCPNARCFSPLQGIRIIICHSSTNPRTPLYTHTICSLCLTRPYGTIQATISG